MCSSSSYRCNDGRCIPDYRECDGYKDCQYGEDESICAKRKNLIRTCNDLWNNGKKVNGTYELGNVLFSEY